MSPVSRYVRHAEKYGTAYVIETAATELSLVEIGELALHLHRIDPKWRPPVDRRVFAVALVENGVRVAEAARMAGLGLRTLRRALTEGQQVPNRHPQSALDRAQIVPNQAPPTRGVQDAQMALSGVAA